MGFKLAQISKGRNLKQDYEEGRMLSLHWMQGIYKRAGKRGSTKAKKG